MAGAQDWCLHCGAGAPGSLDAGGPGWRSATTILALTAILVLGAAAAAYAALSNADAHKTHSVTVVAQTPTPVTPTPTTPVTPAPTTPGAVTPTPTPTTPTTPTVNPLLPTGSTKPPKIPLTAPTPKSSGTTTTPSSTPEANGTAPGSSTGSKAGGGTATEKLPAAILLDTDAATTYNPYGYPASEFGDPSLAIDGDPTTAWTAQVKPDCGPEDG